MSDIGKLLPHPSGEEKVQEWRVPIAVFGSRTGDKYKVVSVYEDEGYLCIDIDTDDE